MHRKSTANPEATDMNDQPMDDKPRRNLATIARKVLRHVYEYIKVDSKSGQLEYMQFCSVHNSEAAVKLSSIDELPRTGLAGMLTVFTWRLFRESPLCLRSHACVECIQLTCPISCGFYVIDVQLWQTTRQQKWLCSICKLTCCPDTSLPQCRCKFRIIWIKPAQEGLELCFTCKTSHAGSAPPEQIPLDNSTRCASARCGTCSVCMHK